MKLISQTFLFFLVIFCLQNLSAQAANNEDNTKLLTLQKAQEIALKNHPEILSSENETKAAKEVIKRERSNYLPQITTNAVKAFAGENTRIAATAGINNPLVINRFSYGVSGSQLITDFGRTLNLISAAKFNYKAQEAQSLSTKNKVLLEVTQAYYNVLRSKALLQVAEKTLKDRKLLLDQIQALWEAKMKSDLDLSFAKQNVDEANLLLLKADTELSNSQAQLSEAMGFNKEQNFILDDKLEISAPSKNIDALQEDAKTYNPILISLKNELQAAQNKYKAEVEAHLPTIVGLGYAGASPVRDDSRLESKYFTGGINISLPLFTGGRLSANQQNAKFTVKATEDKLNEKENQVLRDIKIAWNDAQVSYQRIEVSKQLLKNSANALDLTQARYDLGLNSIVDLSEAQLIETQAEITNANAKYEYLIKEAILDFTVGKKIKALLSSNS